MMTVGHSRPPPPFLFSPVNLPLTVPKYLRQTGGGGARGPPGWHGGVPSQSPCPPGRKSLLPSSTFSSTGGQRNIGGLSAAARAPRHRGPEEQGRCSVCN